MGRGETNAKKRKRQAETKATSQDHTTNGSAAINTSKPTAVFQPTKGRDWTLSVALPGSIIGNAGTHELRSVLAGHIARALAVFCVDEVVVFSDGHVPRPTGKTARAKDLDYVTDDYTGTSDPVHFLSHVLSFLETPPYLRRPLFPLHANLKSAGTLPSLDLPHHLKPEEWCRYREGYALPGADEHGTFVEAGLRIPVIVHDRIAENSRVTLRFDEGAEEKAGNQANQEIKAEAVHPAEPREAAGYYWGFNVRRAACLSDVFTECPFDDGYDISIGTSERGIPIEALYSGTNHERIGKFKHLLVVFGGIAGLEVAVKNDNLLGQRAIQAKDVFDRWVNICPGQGSRTIRTEEAVWIGLTSLRKLVVTNESMTS